jgi:site-specific recombinase
MLTPTLSVKLQLKQLSLEHMKFMSCNYISGFIIKISKTLNRMVCCSVMDVSQCTAHARFAYSPLATFTAFQRPFDFITCIGITNFCVSYSILVISYRSYVITHTNKYTTKILKIVYKTQLRVSTPRCHLTEGRKQNF